MLTGNRRKLGDAHWIVVEIHIAPGIPEAKELEATVVQILSQRGGRSVRDEL